MNFSNVLSRLRNAAQGQRGRGNDCYISVSDLRELLHDWQRLDSIVRNKEAQFPVSNDDAAVDQFSHAMKEKMALASARGRSGWDDPADCSTSYLAELFVKHLYKDNPGNYVDLANFLMMLHCRKAHPSEIINKLMLRVKDDYSTTIELNSLWKSNNPAHGTGIILKITQISETRKDLYLTKDDSLYHFVSDFGNVVVLTNEELQSGYTKFGIEPEPFSRYQRQLRLLQEAYSEDME